MDLLKRRTLAVLLSLLSSLAIGDEINDTEINDHHKNNVKIAILSIDNGKSTFIRNYLFYSNLKNQLKKRNIEVTIFYIDLLKVNNDKFLENLIQASIENIDKINPNYIVLYDAINNEKTLDILEQKYKGKVTSIGFSNSNIELRMNFRSVMKLIDDSKKISHVNVIFVNDQSPIKKPLYNEMFTILKSTRVDDLETEFTFERRTASNLSEMRRLLMECNNSSELCLFVMTVFYLFNDVSGKDLFEEDIYREFSNFNTKSVILFIDSTGKTNTYSHFVMYWPLDKLSSFIDTFIISKHYEIQELENEKVVIDSRIRVNLQETDRIGLFDSVDNNDLVEIFENVEILR